MKQDLRETLNRLAVKILVFDAVILVVLIALALLITKQSKQRLADQLSEAFRAPLLAGDTRQILQDMSRPVYKDFLGFAWKTHEGAREFLVPADLNKPGWILCGSVKVPVFFDEERKVPAGILWFYYHNWSALPLALIAWLFLVGVSIAVMYFERKRMTREYQSALEIESNRLKADMAAQVAHDIRSPVFALDAALKNMTQLPEQQRIIVRHAVNRIRDVANSLLEKNRQKPALSPAADAALGSSGESLDVCLLSSLIDPVVTEKRLSFESKPGINIDFKPLQESYGLFARIQAVEFRRMISNLVNNAVEALGEKGAVTINLTTEQEIIILTVSDNGKGIPPEILAKLGRRGETHGKAGGSGLGLYHARTAAESWGGSLNITSKPDEGTTVSIKLPKAKTPDYFVKELDLDGGRPVLVLDDDIGVHQIWRGRFEIARAKEHGIEVSYFSEPDALRSWVKANPGKAGTSVCLFDYELLGFKETGLSLASELGLCTQTILVTSRSEEPRIIEECARLEARMIPKGLADFVPISISAPAAPARAVLLDDDALTHMTWEMAAQEHGVELQAFSNPVEFLSNLGNFPKNIPLYIDSDLGENLKGENIAAELKEKGFTNICLATAHPPEKFAHLPWLKVITKEPPWV